MPAIGACVCRFKRNEKSPWETGIAILDDPGISDVKLIVDTKGEVLPEPPHNYMLTSYMGVIRPVEADIREVTKG